MKKIFLFNKETLSYENPKNKTYAKIFLYIIACFSILFTLGYFSGTNNYIVNHFVNKTEVTDTLVVHGEPFTEESLIRLLKDCNAKYPHIILAQAKLESANFKSKLFKQNFNVFGMKLARQRITTALGEKDGYAYYRDWVDCIYDYCMWSQIMTSNVSNENEYFNKLQEKYAEDTVYVSKLKFIIEKNKLRNIFED
jgi:hypothetical protein